MSFSETIGSSCDRIWTNTEGVVSLVMIISAYHSTATMRTTRRSDHVASRLMLLCCCERGREPPHALSEVNKIRL
ncbi:hypothetical protein KUCAC02_014668 [Chaenocephalus aceratus]|uniref:Uncharacterized protein n=1 Tax=Chaenocephalus aceratus TaxID=36190 RepID=A0ACB9WEH3_CHAAC|nr:hypothetical protein KUCAC02_014668 [Chaenocephalus aceratus]